MSCSTLPRSRAPKSTIEPCDIIKMLLPAPEYNEKTYDCNYCKQRFNSSPNKYRHQRICKQKPVEESVETKLEQTCTMLRAEMQQIREELHKTNEQPLAKKVNDLTIQLGMARKHKNEDFYQAVVENHLGGTHKSLPCGITDVTNESTHAEIKHWNSYKEAIGQLICYNQFDPKDTLQLYLFGPTPKPAVVETVKQLCQSLNISVFTFDLSQDMWNKTIMGSAHPSTCPFSPHFVPLSKAK